MKSALLCCSALVGIASFAAGAWAQADQGAPNDQMAQAANPSIETVIVTGNRPALNTIPPKATFTESTITPEAILNLTPSPATTVQTLLNTQPSIYATTGATNGMETDIKFRSFSDGEFGETIAGVPLNDIFNSGVTYQADNRNNALFIPRDLDSVNIYRGVNNPAVNTYNSLGGTINYIPRQPTDDMGGEAGVDGGSFNTLDYHVRFDTGDLGGIRNTLSFERDFSSGWLEHTPDWNDNIYYAGNADVNANTQGFAYFIYNKNRGDAPQFIPQNLIAQDWSFQWPGNLYQSNNLDTNYLGIVGFKTQLADILTIEDEAYGGDNNYRRTSFSNPNYAGPYFIDDQGSGYPFWSSWMGYNGYSQFPYNETQAYGSSTSGCAPTCAYAGTDYHFYGYNGALFGDRAQITADLPFNKVTAGGDYNIGVLHSREYWYGAFHMPQIIGYNDAWDEHDSRTIWSMYVQDDFHALDDRLHITPGLKYIESVVKDNDALGIFYFPPGAIKAHEHFLSPTVGASFEVVPDFTIYGSFGRNVKFPDITALYNELGYGGSVPPVTVRPEYANDYEAGARYKWNTLQAEFNLYEEDFSSIIYSAPVPGGNGASMQLNGGNERFRGAELQLTDDFGEIWLGSWKGYLNASYNEAVCTSATSNVLTGGSCNPGQALNNVPDYLMNVGVIWDYDNWHVDLQGRYVGLQHLQDFNTGLPNVTGDLLPGQLSKIPDYFLVNVGIAKVIPVDWAPAQAIRLGFHVDNLFDTHYYSNAQTNTVTGTSLLDFYGLAGEGRAVFGSIGIFF